MISPSLYLRCFCSPRKRQTVQPQINFRTRTTGQQHENDLLMYAKLIGKALSKMFVEPPTFCSSVVKICISLRYQLIVILVDQCLQTDQQLFISGLHSFSGPSTTFSELGDKISEGKKTRLLATFCCKSYFSKVACGYFVAERWLRIQTFVFCFL